MIQISGGELKHTVEITDPELLRNLDPWTGSSIGISRREQAVAAGNTKSCISREAIEQTTPYDKEDLRMIYGLRYCIDEDGGRGSVHLARPE